MPGRSDRESFETLALAHLDAAYNLARWLARDPVLADDIVQDAMLRALKYFGGFRGENARAWLLQIVRNVAFTRLQADAQSRTEANSLDAIDDDAKSQAASIDPSREPEAMLMREQDERLVQKLLADLPLELRECLILREFEELSYKEIARIIDAPIGTVMSRLWRGRQLLAQAAGVAEIL